jgi:small subunit ribosomal protein S17
MADEEKEEKKIEDEAAKVSDPTPAAEAQVEEVSDTADAVDETPAAEPVSDTGSEADTQAEEVSDTPDAVEEAPAADEVPDTGSEAAPPAKPAKSQRHLPRSARRTRSKVAREKPKTRKPITRTSAPDPELGRRQERRGVVVSDKGDKTIVVKVDMIKSHPKYRKVVRRSPKFHTHDEQNQAGVGDTVRIVETRPISKSKRWRLAEIVEKAR